MKPAYPTVGASIAGPPELGDLRLDSVLGSGAFGIVFRASPLNGSGSVAVKFLQAGVLADAHERQALFNEVLAAASVEHEHVIRMLFANLESEQYPPYVVTEFADRGTLQDRLDEAIRTKTLIPLEVVAEWSNQLVAAMQAINARVLHRDLKPDNILFMGDALKVADFGLAKLVGAATRTVTFKGGQHVMYMAPEAWDGKRNEIQIDMYAAGLVLFQVSTLQFPLAVPPNAADFDAFRRMHLLQVPKAARSVRPDLPQRYAEVLDRLLAKRPEARYPTWDDVASSIEQAFASSSAVPQRIPGVVSSLVEQAHLRHRQAVDQRLAAEAEQRERAERQEIDRLQQKEVVECFLAVIGAFNNGTEGPKASMSETGPGIYRIALPFAEPGELSFFTIDPPLRLDQHLLRFGARVADAKGCGFNLLLRRLPDEQFGEWVVCRVRVNPISGRIHRNCTHFGFDAREILEIERGHRAMHVFVPEFSSEVGAAVEGFVQSLYQGER